MTRDKISIINSQRMAGWSKKLNDAHATALLLVGVGHDEKSGEIIICAINEKELTRDVIKGFLRQALELLEQPE